MVRGLYDVKMKGETLFKRVIKSENLVRFLKIYSRTTAQEMLVYIISKFVYRVKILNRILFCDPRTCTGTTREVQV